MALINSLNSYSSIILVPTFTYITNRQQEIQHSAKKPIYLGSIDTVGITTHIFTNKNIELQTNKLLVHIAK